MDLYVERLSAVIRLLTMASVIFLVFMPANLSDGRFAYLSLLIPEVAFTLTLASVALLFPKQLFQLFRSTSLRMQRLYTYIIILLRKRKYISFVITALVAAATFISVSILVVGLSRYAFTEARALKYLNSHLIRQKLTQTAGHHERLENIIEAQRIYTLILTVFPDDDRNHVIKDRLSHYELLRTISHRLTASAERAEGDGRYRLAARLYANAADVWPHAELALGRLRALQQRFAESTSALEEFFSACQEEDADRVQRLQKGLGWILFDQQFETNSQDPTILALMCQSAEAVGSESEFVERHRILFYPAKEASDGADKEN